MSFERSGKNGKKVSVVTNYVIPKGGCTTADLSKVAFTILKGKTLTVK